MIIFLSPLCRVFTIIYLKQIRFLVYIVLQFCICNLCYIQCYFARGVCFVLLHNNNNNNNNNNIFITFVQGIYNNIPETNQVSSVYSAVVLYLQFVLHTMLFRLWSMFCTAT